MFSRIVKIDQKDRSFWTLPGGGIEEGESREETAIREAREEVNLEIKLIRYMFEREYADGTEYCYLAEPIDDSLQNMEKVILVDSTFFGYLTWSIFSMDAPIKD